MPRTPLQCPHQQSLDIDFTMGPLLPSCKKILPTSLNRLLDLARELLNYTKFIVY
jgi:hypothetical protein